MKADKSSFGFCWFSLFLQFELLDSSLLIFSSVPLPTNTIWNLARVGVLVYSGHALLSLWCPCSRTPHQTLWLLLTDICVLFSHADKQSTTTPTARKSVSPGPQMLLLPPWPLQWFHYLGSIQLSNVFTYLCLIKQQVRVLLYIHWVLLMRAALLN